MKANDPNSDRVRFTTDLAHRLGVSRQSINHWRRRIDAPQKQADGWNVPAWQDYMRHNKLNQAGVLSASDVANEVAAAIRSRLPPQVRREQLGRFLQFALPVIPVFFEPHQSIARHGQ